MGELECRGTRRRTIVSVVDREASVGLRFLGTKETDGCRRNGRERV
jgi:hypothetical protein